MQGLCSSSYTLRWPPETRSFRCSLAETDPTLLAGTRQTHTLPFPISSPLYTAPNPRCALYPPLPPSDSDSESDSPDADILRDSD